MSSTYSKIPVQDFFYQLLTELGIDLHVEFQRRQVPNFGEVFELRPSSSSHSQLICDTINSWLATSQLKYIVKNTEGSGTPSLCVYEQSDMSHQAYTTGLKLVETNDPSLASSAGVAWAWVAMMFEVDFRPPDTVARGQIARQASYDRMHRSLRRQEVFARRIMQYQHRRHLFTILILGRELRLACWDRAGCVVTETLDYVEDPEALFRFLFAFATAAPGSQGYDETITVATPEQVRALEDYTPNPEFLESTRAELLKAKNTLLDGPTGSRFLSPVYSVKCNDTTYRDSHIPQDQRTYTYLIGEFQHAPRSLFGNGTRCFVAFDIDHNAFVHMKDNWILEDPDEKTELEAYGLLFRAGVRFVPTALAGGFVGTQKTWTQNFVGTMEKGSRRGRRHSRLIVSQIGRSLWEFRDTRELASTFRDALTAHQDAYELVGVLHRDVTADNILIDVITGRGYLSNWEMSSHLDTLSRTPRTGTWSYMSVLLLTYPRKPNSLSDDLESFVWSLLLVIARFVLNDCSMVQYPDGKPTIDIQQYNSMLWDWVENLYHMKYRRAGQDCGGMFKAEQVIHYPIFGCRPFDDSGALAELVRRLHALLHEFYVSLDEAELEAQWGIPGNDRAYPRLLWKAYSPPTTPRSDCLDTHTRIRAAFSEVLDDPSLKWTDVRTVDQFTGAFDGVYQWCPDETSIHYGNAKRYLVSDSDDDESDTEPESKRARLTV